MLSLREYANTGKIIVAAHRGASRHAPENTLAAYRLAIDEGALMIETDLHFTSDGQIVAYHDLSRFRSILGKEPAAGYSYTQLKTIDAGSWFSKEFTGESIPIFDDILELVKGKVYLNIEIKSLTGEVYPEQIESVIAAIKKNDVAEHVMISSFRYGFLKSVKKIFPELPIAVIQLPGEKRLPSQVALECNADAFICAVSELNREMSDDIGNSDIFLGIYSVDKPEKLPSVLQYNVTAIGTNCPAEIVKAVNLVMSYEL